MIDTHPTPPNDMKNTTGKAAAAGDIAQAEIDMKAKAKTARDEALAEQLFAFQTEHRVSDIQLGKLLGYSGTYVSRYRTRTFEGDLKAFEESISALMQKRLLLGEDENLSRTGYCVASVADFLDYLAARGQMGVGHGAAGLGKTRACRLYAADHPGVIYLHLWDWTARKELMVRDIAKAASVHRTAKGDFNITEALVRALKGSARLLILDNAHEVTPSGRRWLADFHDATGIPIALIGNPEIVDKFASNDQHASRLGRCCEITTVTDKKATIMHSLTTYFPEAAEDIEVQRLALEAFSVVNGGGGRTVKRLLQAAKAICGTSKRTTAAEAVKIARSQLLTARRAA
jgi:DNA transposition AAA+ family ATPase